MRRNGRTKTTGRAFKPFEPQPKVLPMRISSLPSRMLLAAAALNAHADVEARDPTPGVHPANAKPPGNGAPTPVATAGER